MANSSLRFLLGLYPKTKNIEKHLADLIKEFDQINQYARSEELARYEYLDKFINSPDFLEQKLYFKNLTFKNSGEKKKEDEYLKLKKSKEIKFYFRFMASQGYDRFLKMDVSEELEHFKELKLFIESSQFKKVEEYMKDKNKWEKTEDFRKINDYKVLIKKIEFKNYFKFIGLKEYNDLIKHLNSKDIILYESLELYFNSRDFKMLKSSMKRKKFREHETYKNFQVYRRMKKDKSLQNYFKLSNNNLFANYKIIHNSKELFNYKELENFVINPELKTKEKQLKSLRFNQTQEYIKLQEYKKLASSKPVKEYFKMNSSQELAEFKNLKGSKLIADYNSLEKYVLSDEFKNKKIYLLDKHKWDKSDEKKQYTDYIILKKAPKIKWYFKLKDSPKYNTLRTWKLSFEDDFNSGKLDRDKWITRYFWGEVVLNDSYALPDEKHLFSSDGNIKISDSAIHIITMNEKVQGKVWNSDFGFFTKDFDYTSGIINTGSSFRTKYGRIEAKVKLNSTKGIFHSFWLSGDTKLPQIDIFKHYNNKLYLSTYWNDNSDSGIINNDTVSLNGSFFTGKYMIYSLEWTPEKITWLINGLIIKTQINNIPDEMMYISLNSGVIGESTGPLPTSLDIDWVRIYQKY